MSTGKMSEFTERLRECEDDFLNDEAADIIDELERALMEIAAYDDEFASRKLEETGSYGKFDEPNSVRIAREALNKLRNS